MKKLDLHIHTINTVSDNGFVFSFNKLKEYIETMHIDCIAITNHNLFDMNQYSDIRKQLSGICEVLPGIEINIGNRGFGHIICITDQNDIADFAERCQKVNDVIRNKTDKITFEELKLYFSDLKKYLWIPHYDKKPAVESDILLAMKDCILCGETGSIKKFIYCQNKSDDITPVYFSDFRPTDADLDFPTRQTFFDIEEISIQAIKKTLLNKKHVSLTESEGNSLFFALPELPISTGLNIIIGERSSGKTYTLNKIANRYENTKYIKQFALIETDPEKAAKEFADRIAAKRSSFAEEYFEPFSDAVDIVKNISLIDDKNAVEQYITSLIRSAKEADRADMFARCSLYNEIKFPQRNFENIKGLIDAVQKLLDAREYRIIIDRHISREDLVALHKELIGRYNFEKRKSLEETWVNDLVDSIKRSLRTRTAAVDVPDVDFYNIQMNRTKVERFNDLVSYIKKECVINRQDVEGFVIQTKKRAFNGPGELKNQSGKRDVTFSAIMDSYSDSPYDYLIKLENMPEIVDTDYYKYFAYIDYQILNNYGFEVSGGERAEFNLLQEISDANRYDMLLIDEPESSFDNIFLRDSVNHIIKELAKNMPVVLVTHNNTVGASINPDFIINTKRILGEDKVRYERYYGLPCDKELVSCTGEKIRNVDALLDCLEAGEQTYNERKKEYELLKN